MLRTSEEDLVVITLDHVDSRHIVLGSADENTPGIHASTREKEKRRDRVLEEVRTGSIQKRGRGRPTRNLVNREEGASEEMELEETLEIPYLAQAHTDPFAIIQPPDNAGKGYANLGPDQDLPVTRRKVQFKEVKNEELEGMMRLSLNRMAAAFLRQEVRGIAVADLLGQDHLREQIKTLLQEP